MEGVEGTNRGAASFTGGIFCGTLGYLASETATTRGVRCKRRGMRPFDVVQLGLKFKVYTSAYKLAPRPSGFCESFQWPGCALVQCTAAVQS